MTFPVLNKPYKYFNDHYKYEVVFIEKTELGYKYSWKIFGDFFSNNLFEGLDPWPFENIEPIKHKFLPLFREDITDKEYEDLWV